MRFTRYPVILPLYHKKSTKVQTPKLLIQLLNSKFHIIECVLNLQIMVSIHFIPI